MDVEREIYRIADAVNYNARWTTRKITKQNAALKLVVGLGIIFGVKREMEVLALNERINNLEKELKDKKGD